MKETCLDKKIAVLEERLTGAQDALKIQAREYERRLETLNHEAQQLKDMQAKYLPREVYEANYKETNTKIEALQKYIWIGVGGLLVIELVLKYIK